MRISKYLPDIVKLLSTTPILFLIAPTGTGKSLGLPAALAVVGSRVFVSVPTRASVMNLYSRQLTIASSLKNITVGYAAEGDIQYTDKTKIVYVTSGHLRRKIRSTYSGERPGPIDFCDVLILDEIHNGSLDNAINLGLWEKAAREGITVPRLVLASATFPDTLDLRFSEEDTGRKTFKFEAQAFPVTIQYHDKSFDPKDSEIYRQMSEVIRTLISRNPKGDLLAFIPGSPEAQTLIELLNNPPMKDCDLIPAYGTLTNEEKRMIDQPAKKGRRKVIVATNMAETSITLDDLDFIVDSMLEKRAETSDSGGKKLTLSRIARDSAVQRAGRTGRLAPGYCYRMITEEDYNKKLDAKRPDEIQRLPLEGVILELISIGLAPETLLSDVKPDRLRKALDLLFSLGCINEKDKVTDKGVFAAEFPLSVKNASVLYEWTLTKKPLFPALVSLALLDSYGPSNYLWVTKKKIDESETDFNVRVEEYKKKYFLAYRDKSDLGTFLNVWHDFFQSVGYPNNQDYQIKKWCTEGSVNHRQWKDMLSNLRTCINTIKRLGYRLEYGPFTTKGALSALKPIFLDVYKDSIFTAIGDQYQDAEGLKYRLDSHNSFFNKISPQIDEQIIALIQIELSAAGSDKGIRIISVAMPVKDEPEELKIFNPDEVEKVGKEEEEEEETEKLESPKKERPGNQWVPKATPGIQKFITPTENIEDIETTSSLLPEPEGTGKALDIPIQTVELIVEEPEAKKIATPKTKAVAKAIKKTVSPKAKVTVKTIKKIEEPKVKAKVIEETKIPEEEKTVEIPPVKPKATVSPKKIIKPIVKTKVVLTPVKAIEEIKIPQEEPVEISPTKTTEIPPSGSKATPTGPKKVLKPVAKPKLIIKPITKKALEAIKATEIPPVKATEIPEKKEEEEVRKEGKEEEGKEEEGTGVRPLPPSGRGRGRGKRTAAELLKMIQ